MDDAPALRTPRSRARIVFGLILAALAGGALCCRLVPGLIPGLALFEARSEGIAVRGRRSSAAEAELRQRFAERVAARSAMNAARARIRSSLADRFPPGPWPGQSRAAACAAELRGVALALEALASHAPHPATPMEVEPPAPFAAVRGAIARAARAGDPVALDSFCLEEQSRWSAWWTERVRSLPPERRAAVWSEWVAVLNARASELESMAGQIEPLVTPFQLQMVPYFAQLRALAIEPQVGDPSLPLTETPAAPQHVTVRPVLETWLLLALAGALAGAGLGAASLGALARRPRAAVPRGLPAADARSVAWLQIVTGASTRRVARAACELAAQALSRGERVVVIEASPRLRIHRGLRLSPRLGWSECAIDGLPALGLVQNGGFTGLFLLAYGRAGRIRTWLPLDRVLEELRPHFSRVVLALDDSAPAEVGSLLAGRVMNGWWAGPGPGGRGRAELLEARLSILLRDLSLKALPHPTLEAIERRLSTLGAPPSRPAPVVPPAPAPRPVPVEIAWISRPAVLDSDLQLRQRLHFLAWMRRLKAQQRDRERETAAPV